MFLVRFSNLEMCPYCCVSGYEFVFPFLSAECGVSVVDRQVRPLYKHIIHTEYQRMAFIGLPTVVLPFPLFHKQVGTRGDSRPLLSRRGIGIGFYYWSRRKLGVLAFRSH